MNQKKEPTSAGNAPVFEGFDRPTPPKPWVQKGGWALVALLAYGGITTRYKVALLFAALYAITLLSEKTIRITAAGLEQETRMKVANHREVWPWQDIFSVTYEALPQTPGRVALYFTCGDRTRRLYFAKEEQDEILALGKRQNPALMVYNAADHRPKA